MYHDNKTTTCMCETLGWILLTPSTPEKEKRNYLLRGDIAWLLYQPVDYGQVTYIFYALVSLSAK